jgi:7-cyano-7-deazaguanine synthase
MEMMAINRRAVVLASGGLDSTTVLAIARADGYQCHTLSFDYGQRHLSELIAAKRCSEVGGAVEHRVVSLDLRAIGGSALTDSRLAVPEEISSPGCIPITYVPARNTIFLSIALGWAEVLEANAIYIGVNAVDYSGYPDCRPEYLQAFQSMANLATRVGVEGGGPEIVAPLLSLTKGQIIRRGIELGVDYRQTVSCYQADMHGYACGRCDSCRLRKFGFIEAGVEDPTRYQL